MSTPTRRRGHRHPPGERPRQLHRADQGAVSVPVELGFLPDRAGPAALRRGPRLDRGRDALRPSMARRHGAAYRVPPDGRRLFPRPRCLGHRPAGADLAASPSRPSPASPCASFSTAPADRAAAETRARALLPKVAAWHRWFHQMRDPGHEGLVAILHPWEAGRDNSIDWDEAFERVPTEGIAPYTRRDTQHADPAHRPTKAQYDRYLWLVEHFRGLGWDNATPARRLAVPRRRSRLQRHPDPLGNRPRRAGRGAGRGRHRRREPRVSPLPASPRWMACGRRRMASISAATAPPAR